MPLPPLPVLFVSHGAPDLLLTPGPTLALWSALGRWLKCQCTAAQPADDAPKLAPIRAVLAISAHWQAAAPTLGAAIQPRTLHDFSGFDPQLGQWRYPVAGDPALAATVRQQLWEAGIAADIDPQRGLDHGVWAPLSQMLPQADVPVIPLSLTRAASPAWHLQLGRLLRPLRQQGILILASGAVTHNLRRCQPVAAAEHPADLAAGAFADWIAAALSTGQGGSALSAYRLQAPHAALMHPEEEHLLPLLVALGAGGSQPPQRLISGTTLGTLVMDSYLWSDTPFTPQPNSTTKESRP